MRSPSLIGLIPGTEQERGYQLDIESMKVAFHHPISALLLVAFSYMYPIAI